MVQYGMANKQKGGKEEMEINQTVFKEVCEKCGKEIIATTDRQAKANMATHKLYCKASINENAKQ